MKVTERRAGVPEQKRTRMGFGKASVLFAGLAITALPGTGRAVPVRSIPNLASITFWEATGPSPTSSTFGIASAELTTRLADPLSSSNQDITGVPGLEFYDVFYSDADGTFNLDGEFLTIEGVYPLPLPAGGGLNLAEIGLNFSGGPPTEFGNFVASFVALGNNAIPGDVGNAIDGDLQTWTTMGNTQDTSERLRVTLGFLSSSGPSPPTCASSPASGCRLGLPGKSSLQLIDASNDLKDQLKWSWRKGAATSASDFLDPVGASPEMAFCLYDASGNSQPLLQAAILAGGTCGTKPCWKLLGSPTNPKGYKFKSKAGTPNGVIAAKLKAGVQDKAQVQVKAKGIDVPLPVLPLTMPVTVQLLIGDGGATNCWQSTFTTPIRNDPQQLKVKGP